MTLTTTAVVLAVTAALTVLCGYMGQRPMNPVKGPSLIPWRFLMVLFFTASLLMVVHLLNLSGVPTGQNQPRY